MSRYKIIVEEVGNDDNKKEFNCDEYWLFLQENDGEDSHFQHQYNASNLFRGHVQSHVTLVNLAEHMDKIKNHEENGEKIN